MWINHCDDQANISDAYVISTSKLGHLFTFILELKYISTTNITEKYISIEMCFN